MHKLLEALIDAPEDEDLSAAYADWLQSQHDPRGELIAVQSALHSGLRPARFSALLQREQALLVEHHRTLLGALKRHSTVLEPDPRDGRYVHCWWRRGFINRAIVSGPVRARAAIQSSLKVLVSHPSSQILTDLTVSAFNARYGVVQGPLLTPLIEYPRPALQNLRIIGIAGDSSEELDAVLEQHPKLDSLTLLGPYIHLPQRAAQVAKLTIGRGTFNQELERFWLEAPLMAHTLELRCLDTMLDAQALARTLNAARFPNLKVLKLRHIAPAQALAQALAPLALLRQLESLEISAGGPIDTRELRALPDGLRFKHGPSRQHLEEFHAPGQRELAPNSLLGAKAASTEAALRVHIEDTELRGLSAADLYLAWGHALLQAQRFSQATERLREGLAFEKGMETNYTLLNLTPDLLTALSQSKLQSGYSAEVLRLRSDPMAIAEAARFEGKPEDGLSALNQATSPASRSMQSRLYLQRARPKRAHRALQELRSDAMFELLAGQIALMQDELQVALSCFKSADRMARSRTPMLSVRALFISSGLHLRQGELTDGQDAASEAITLAVKLGNRPWERLARFRFALIQAREGGPAEALESAFSQLVGPLEAELVLEAMMDRATWLLDQDRAEAASESLDGARDHLRGRDLPLQQARYQQLRAVCALRGPGSASSLEKSLEGLTTNLPGAAVHAQTLLITALCSLQRGETQTAKKRIRRALDLYEQAQMPAMQQLCARAWSGLLAMEKTRSARKQLANAQALATDLLSLDTHELLRRFEPHPLGRAFLLHFRSLEPC